MTTRHFLWATALTLTVASVAMAQSRATTADVTGTVLDQTNAALPGATVTATNTGTNAVRSTTTDGQGRFTIPALPPGTYTVVCELTGFTTEKAEHVTLTLGEWRMLEFNLRVAGTTEEVRVSEQAPLVDIQNTSVSSVVSQEQIETPADQRPQLHLVLGHHAGRDRRPDAAAGRVGHVRADVRRPARAVEQHHGRRPRQQRHHASAACARRSARRPCASSRCSRTPIRRSSARRRGGVVNIVTKSGTNTTCRQRLRVLPRRRAERQGLLREVRPGRERRSTRTRRRTARSSSAATLGGPIRQEPDVLLRVVRAARRRGQQLRHHRRHDDRCATRSPDALGTPLQILSSAGFPVADGNSRTRS